LLGLWVLLAYARLPQRITNIGDLEENKGNFTLVAYVKEKSETEGYAIIEDITGTIKLNLQKHQIKQVQVGQAVRISGAFTRVNSDFLEVYCWKGIEQIEDSRVSLHK
jgi:hypothetical protein